MRVISTFYDALFTYDARVLLRWVGWTWRKGRWFDARQFIAYHFIDWHLADWSFYLMVNLLGFVIQASFVEGK